MEKDFGIQDCPTFSPDYEVVYADIVLRKDWDSSLLGEIEFYEQAVPSFSQGLEVYRVSYKNGLEVILAVYKKEYFFILASNRPKETIDRESAINSFMYF